MANKNYLEKENIRHTNYTENQLNDCDKHHVNILHFKTSLMLPEAVSSIFCLYDNYLGIAELRARQTQNRASTGHVAKLHSSSVVKSPSGIQATYMAVR